MPYEGKTGVVIPVPEADALLASVAARFAGVVREGVPAHVSVQYPFVAVGQLDDRVIASLSELFAVQKPIPVTFAECRRSGGFVYLCPDPAEDLAKLTAQLREQWPDVAFPAGADDEVGQHLTVAMRASEQAAEAIEQQVIAALPIPAELREAWLVAFESRWTLRGRFEFAADD